MRTFSMACATLYKVYAEEELDARKRNLSVVMAMEKSKNLFSGVWFAGSFRSDCVLGADLDAWLHTRVSATDSFGLAQKLLDAHLIVSIGVGSPIRFSSNGLYMLSTKENPNIIVPAVYGAVKQDIEERTRGSPQQASELDALSSSSIDLGDLGEDDIQETCRNTSSRFCRSISDSHWFSRLFFVLVLLNTLVLATNHHGQPEVWSQFINWTNTVLTLLFLVETCIKLGAYPLGEFMSDKFNVLDALLVAVSITDLLITVALGGSSRAAGVTAARAIRSLRAVRALNTFRLVKHFEALIRALRVLGRVSGAFLCV